MKKHIILIGVLLVFFSIDDTLNDIVSIMGSCDTCTSKIQVINFSKDSVFLSEKDLNTWSINDFQLQLKDVEPNDVSVESIVNLSKYYYIISLGGDYRLKIVPEMPEGFKYDYLNAELEDIIKQTGDMKIKCMYLFKSRECISSELMFRISLEDSFQFIFQGVP